jgi:hypothetical protein
LFKRWFGKSQPKNEPPENTSVNAAAVARLEELTFRRPLKRLEELWGGEPQGLIRWYGVALALGTRDTVRDFMTLNPPDRSFGPVFQQFDTEKLERLAAFSAWWLNDRTLDDYPEIYSNEDGSQDETSAAILADLSRCVNAMYVIGDPIVSTAIQMYTAADQGVVDNSISTFSASMQHVDSMDVLVGVVPITFDKRSANEMKLSAHRSFAITGVLVGNRAATKTYLDQVMDRESGKHS